MVDLPDMNPEAFENYRHFLYTYKLDSLEGCRVEEFSLLNSRQKCCEIVLESLIYQNLLHLDYQSLLKCHELGDYIMDFGFRDAISNALREKLRNDHALPFTVPGLMYTISEPGSPLRKMLRFHAVFHLYRWTADFRDNQNVDPLHPDLMADILLTRFQIDQTLHAINLNGCDATRPLIPMFWRANGRPRNPSSEEVVDSVRTFCHSHCSDMERFLINTALEWTLKLTRKTQNPGLHILNFDLRTTCPEDRTEDQSEQCSVSLLAPRTLWFS